LTFTRIRLRLTFGAMYAAINQVDSFSVAPNTPCSCGRFTETRFMPRPWVTHISSEAAMQAIDRPTVGAGGGAGGAGGVDGTSAPGVPGPGPEEVVMAQVLWRSMLPADALRIRRASCNSPGGMPSNMTPCKRAITASS